MSTIYEFLPMAVMADSYKATHFQQYPEAKKMVAYSECRTGFDNDTEDNRIVVFGVRFSVEKILHRQWTLEEINLAEQFYNHHLAPSFRKFPFPRHLFVKFVEENDGYFPMKFEALEDGTCVHAHVPIYQITTEGCYAPLCTFLETVLTMIWYPITVATLARRVRDCIEKSFQETTEEGTKHPLVNSRLHDFGFRACTSVEQAVIGGCAHLLSFAGTDTMPASFYAQFKLNKGHPVGTSIPATEHSVMTSWMQEKEAIEHMIELYGTDMFACVMDSYDYINALEKVLPSISEHKVSKGGFMILRPDSGDPTEAVLQALEAAEKVFGAKMNQKGFKVLNGCGVIQGDGMNAQKISNVLHKVKEKGYSAENCAFGMGGGLLQKINRDTMSFATKLSHIVYASGESKDIMKTPKEDSQKFSLPGQLAVKRVKNIPTVFPKEQVAPEENLLKVVYDHRPINSFHWETFDEIRSRLEKEWNSLPLFYDAVSDSLKQKISHCTNNQKD